MKFLILLFFLSDLNAQQISKDIVLEVVEEIKIINTGKLANPIAPMCISTMLDSDSVTRKSSQLFNRCAIDLCGPPSKNKSVYTSNESHAKFLKKSAQKIISKESGTIEKIIDKSLVEKKSQLESIKNFINNPTQIFASISPDEKIEINKRIFSEFIKVEFTKDNNYKNRALVKTTPPSWADDNFKGALALFAKNYQEHLIHDTGTQDKLNLTLDQQRQRIQDLGKEIINLHNLKPELINNSFTQARYQNLVDLMKLKKLDEDKIDEHYEDALFLRTFLISKGGSISGGSLCEQSICDDARKAYFQSPKNKASLANYERLLSNPQTKIQAQNRCKAGLISGEIEESDSKLAQKAFLNSSALVKNKYLARFSEHSKKMLENYIDKSLMITNESVLSLDTKINTIGPFKDKASDYLYNKSTPNQDPAELVTNFFKITDDLDKIDPLAGGHPCTTYSTTLWDAFLSIEKVKAHLGANAPMVSRKLKDKDRIFVSPFSCQHADHGVHTTAHEIGHALNSFFKLNKVSPTSAQFFNELRSCATKSYVNPEAAFDDGFIHKGDSILTEEDHADLIAFIAVGDKNIYSCSFLKPSVTTDTYLDLDFKNHPGDAHSNPFARVILEATNKDIKLPQSCSDLIEEVKPNMRISKCI